MRRRGGNESRREHVKGEVEVAIYSLGGDMQENKASIYRKLSRPSLPEEGTWSERSKVS